MKLWLDDVRPAPDGWVHCYTVGDAISWAVAIAIDGYGDGDFSEVSLDHDLADGPGRDGIAFVDWMAENNIWPRIKPVVHSMNPVGRKRLEMTIERYWSEPT